jgi:hypothetical protein
MTIGYWLSADSVAHIATTEVREPLGGQARQAAGEDRN